MAHEVDIHEAKTHLSRLLAEAEEGGDVVIVRAGRPVARLVAYRPTPRLGRRSPGVWRGRVEVAADDDGLPDETAAAFRGELP